MLKKYALGLMMSLGLFAFSTITTASEEQCTARYDVSKNRVHVPCVMIGEEKIWANLKLIQPENTFAIEGFDKDFLPLWLVQKIDGFIKVPTATDRPLLIRQFEYKGARVYYFASQCCDMFNILYDTTGNVICAPDGGFTGRGDETCPDFAETSIAGTIIWDDTKK
ncbi:hypothetical protein R2103_10610 [Nitrosomonas sp. Is24]|uniref:DUF6970 domain-containing protein n=1 Tax=Nitrosomonas sp. Is24 TaxID=3080533 RepID=UPI00294B8F65|nr:hypothetical protein [Nitrosomonas sp. Is24]MDV6342214.1 hypothetical protein [Nitrosomonas sp. Is24]